jgi:hypothetical protein
MKREYGAGRSRLKGDQGARIWQAWGALAYNLDTVAAMKLPTDNRRRPASPAQETQMA